MEIHRLAAFTEDAAGGNPAGVVVTDEALQPSVMQEVAAEVGYSETAFLSPSGGRTYRVRYFAPEAEVPFCGHATIASGVLLGARDGPGQFVFETGSGPVRVGVEPGPSGEMTATLVSVEPSVEPVAPAWLPEALTLLRLDPDELDPRYRPAVAFAGARHLLLVLRDRDRLARLDYDFEGLRELMVAEELTTVALLWREAVGRWHARNAFPVGGVVEDPATGAAAAAFGAFLRELGVLDLPTELEIVQGVDMGRPSRLQVRMGVTGGIAVSGRAVSLG